MTLMLPAAIGFSVEVRRDGGRPIEPAFAALGSLAKLTECTADHVVRTVLLHSGAPERAYAHAEGWTVVLAGELYNQDELERLLPADASWGGDAELILALFAVYDVHAFRLFNGRFAALVTTGVRAVLATDHAGSVPLYVAAAPGRVLAATEAKALRTAPKGLPLTGRCVPGLPGVHQVSAGTVLDFVVANGEHQVHRTWAPPLARQIVSEEEAVGGVRSALAHAVSARIGTGRPLVVLSGGIDSSSVAALAAQKAAEPIDTVSMGTDEADEFPHARTVAQRLGSTHREVTIGTEELLRRLPHAVWASEGRDPDIIEYLLPLTALYLRMEGAGRRILTGYGADIPLGGMHREDRLPQLDAVVCRDMDTFDGLNEMTPVLSAIAGHWSTHPYWDRQVLDLLVSLEAGLKRRYGQDKWVLRAAMGDLLPVSAVIRPKLGVHEGSGTTSAFTRLLIDAGVPGERVTHAKQLVVLNLFDQVVTAGIHPDDVAVETVVAEVMGRLDSAA
ncbi:MULTISPECIES: asparagine synthase-related protein [unclassified Streptomyces]|uniref:asparagine synthase-related protein n=1 Tax=unclassified Streptomyces TaxID=2593676 RepID=UPI00044FF443|nr:carboxyethyl-arginine beta-lactam-synthase [Streptomyces sp. PRh5]TMU98299.1 asparagine synthase [Streptomyces sp. DASNCL29]